MYVLTKQVSCPPAKIPAQIIESIIPLFRVFLFFSLSYNWLHFTLSMISKSTFNKSSLERSPILNIIILIKFYVLMRFHILLIIMKQIKLPY